MAHSWPFDNDLRLLAVSRTATGLDKTESLLENIFTVFNKKD